MTKCDFEWFVNALQVPAVLSEELRYSPYLQTGRPSVRALLGLPDHAREDLVLAELRRRKDLYDPLK